MVRSQLVEGGGSRPEIAIIRKGEKGQERTVATEDAELQPGDTVEVTLVAGRSEGLDRQASSLVR
jgi:polysaccharide export outer membrane protein